MTLSSKTALVIDRGLYAANARRLGESFGKVWYALNEADPYPTSPLSDIGKGFPEMERVRDFWPYLDKADAVVFFDCYDGAMQEWLRSKGHRVFGAGNAEKLELDKVFFLEALEEAGLPVPPTELCEGEEELRAYLERKKDRWIKTSFFRGDFETYHHRGMAHTESWLDDLKRRVGRRIETMEFLVQDRIDAACEVGIDSFMVDGEVLPGGVTGYEVKDKGFVGFVQPETPKILDLVNRKMSPIVKKLGTYRGHWSTELRVTKQGVPYFIDPTCRAPSPPSEAMCELFENYADVVYSVASGEKLPLRARAPYCAQVVLTSEWHDSHELLVECPKELERWVKLKNPTRRNGKDYAIPNGNGSFFGSVVAVGKSVKEATSKCMEYLDEIEAEGLEYDPNVFEAAQEAIEAGEQYAGVPFA